MSVIEENISSQTTLVDVRKNRDPFILIPDLPMTEFIEDDDPLLDFLPREAVDRWNELVRQNIESGGEIERREKAAREAARVNQVHDTPAFMPDNYIAELPPQDVLSRWAAEANSTEMRESYRETFIKHREQLVKSRN